MNPQTIAPSELIDASRQAMSWSFHAHVRAQQRAIPPLIEHWLDAYGDEDYDGHGARRIFFSRKSIRNMERDFGRAPVRKMSQWLDVYKVEDSSSGHLITIGHRYQHLKRK
jgi:hypothetical protein